MLPLLFDENFNQRILRGLKLRLPALDYLIVQEAGMKGMKECSGERELDNQVLHIPL